MSAKFPKRPASQPRAPRPREDDPPGDRRDERRTGGDRPTPRGDRRQGRTDRQQRPDARPPRDDRPPAAAPAPAAATAWESQAAWYDQLLGAGGDDFYRDLVLPATLRQLQAKPGQRVLDVCCGQGVLGRTLAGHGVRSLGVDASPTLIAAAQSRAGASERYLVGDARALDAVLGDERVDHAALVMALQDLDPIEPAFTGIATRLPRGGRLVIVLSHPCFRIPKRTGWGWDEQWGVQYRRVDAYLTPQVLPIKTHPGMPQDAASSSSFHRPLSTYLAALGAAGFGVIAAEELCSARRGTKGPRYMAEDRAAREIPVFLVLTAVRLG